jgi:hypothetical protein
MTHPQTAAAVKNKLEGGVATHTSRAQKGRRGNVSHERGVWGMASLYAHLDDQKQGRGIEGRRLRR